MIIKFATLAHPAASSLSLSPSFAFECYITFAAHCWIMNNLSWQLSSLSRLCGWHGNLAATIFSHLSPACCKSNLRQFSSFPAHAKTTERNAAAKKQKHIKIVTKSLAVHKQNEFIIICILKLIAWLFCVAFMRGLIGQWM